MDEWPTVTIADIGEVFDGPHATPKTVAEGPVFLGIGALNNGRLDLGETRHVTPEDFKKWTRRVEPRAGDVVFSYETRLGEAAIIPDGLQCCLGRRMGLVRVDTDRILPRFFLYNYIAPHYQEFLRSRTVHGATVDRILLKEFPSFPFPCPPLKEQEKFVSLLGALDDKIELNRQTNETLEALARAIFKDWFVEFGPTRAKAEGRAPYLAPALWDLFPDRMDAEGKPDGWEISEIGNEVDAVGRATPSTKESSYWDGGQYCWATPKDLSKLATPVLLDTDRRITDSGVAKISSGLLPVGTVLMSSRAPIGYLAVAEVPTAINQGFIAMVCNKRLPNVFVLFWCEENLDHIKCIAGGSTFAEISKKAFRPVPVVVPSPEILESYTAAVRPLYERVVANTQESETLAQTRNLLLPKLMSGEIRLRDAERMVEDAA